MTELEKMERARMYMDKLANGINPLDDSPIPDGELINHVRLSRCFFYVSDILRQVIENGGEVTKSRKMKKLPFSLSEEQRKNFPYSDQAVTITVFTRQINEMIDTETMEALKYSSITNWLVAIGMMKLPGTDSRYHTKTPTPEGNRIGIRSEERVGQNGLYLGVYYEESAQQFILDHLDTILEFERSTTELQGTPWTPQQDQCLRELYEKGVAVAEIAITLKRNSSSVHSRLKKLGLKE